MKHREAHNACQRVKKAPVDLHALASLMPVGMLVIDREERVVYTNPAAESLLGRPFPPVERLRCGDVLACRNRMQNPAGCGSSALCAGCPLYQAICSILHDGNREFVCGETEVLRDGGLAPVWLKYQAGPIFLDRQKCVLMTLDDITARKKMELQLAERADFAQRILNATDTHIAVVDASGKILAVNQAWQRFAQANGGGSEGCWGPGASYFRPCLPQDPDARLAERIYEGLRGVQQGELPHFVEVYPCHSPEERRWFEMHVLPMPGAAGQALVSHRNVTHQKMTEAALKEQNANLAAVLESTDDLIASRDRDGRLIFFNSAFDGMVRKVFGRPAEPGLKTTELMSSERQRHWESVLDRVLQGERIQQEFEWQFEDLVMRHFEISLSPIRSGDHVIGTVEFTRDVTVRKQAAMDLQKSYDDLVLREKTAQLFLTAGKDRVFTEVLLLLRDAFESRHGFFGYMDENGCLVCPSMTHEVWSECRMTEKDLVFPPDKWGGIWGKSLRQRRACLQNGNLHPPMGHVRLRNALVVPLMVDQNLVGQIALANKPAGYSNADLARLESIARFIAPILHIFLERDHAAQELKNQAQKLEERNIALNVLLENRDTDRKDLAEKIRYNFQNMVWPYIDRIKVHRRKEDLQTLLQIVETNIQESLAPLEKHMPSFYPGFTPMEIQVADLIKAGKTSKEIAAMLCISPRSVFFHRNNIRKKLKIDKTKANLRAFLLSILSG